MPRRFWPLLGFAAAALARPAAAVPSYAVQTGEHCISCHVGAFGPQLTALGREFKLNGYTLTDGEDHTLPLAAMAQFSFTHTRADQAGGASPGFGANDDVASDQLSLFAAGRLFDHAGAFVQLTYDGVAHQFHWDNLDLRYARTAMLEDGDLVYGVTINNNPTVQDLWNSTPAWGFPFAASPLAPTPGAATLIDGGLAQEVLGVGGYASWDDLIYAELDLYESPSVGLLKGLGIASAGGDSLVSGTAPYWRVALQHTMGAHYASIGTYGMAADLTPGNVSGFGTDRLTDVALDATYQYTPGPELTVAAYATWIHEDQALNASRQISGTRPSDTLSTFRANASVTWQGSYTLNLQRFATVGSADPALYPTSSPNSAGWITEADWTPGGKPDSFMPEWLNLKLSLQYVDYTKFDGTTQGASANDNLYALAWFAVPLE